MTWKPKNKANNFIFQLKNIDLLIIDDIGKEKLTETRQADIFEIIDFRYLHNKTGGVR